MNKHHNNVPQYLLDGVTQAYGGRTVLHVDSLAITPKSIVGLTGHNGSGKSTLLRILGFLEEPVQGKVFFKGEICSGRQNGIRRKVTLLPQEPYLLRRSVQANVSYGLKVRGRVNSLDKVREALDTVGLSPERFAKRSWHELSGGEAQRVALAARLVLRPKVLLLDEPTANLDAESTERIKEASLVARKDWETTLVVVSHDMAWLRSVCDNMVALADGRLVKKETL
jgi:tungstate transport system ATP-binding protein